MVRDTPVIIEQWEIQKNIINSPDVTVLERGFATFFLNRCNRSGILKAGPIGGRGQQGDWKIHVRFNKDNLIERILRIAERRGDIVLSQQDALSFMKYIAPAVDLPLLVYLDPPYFKKGGQLYLNSYCYRDHVDLACSLDGVEDFHWLMTYDNAEEIRQLYFDSWMKLFSLNYFAHHAKKGEELLIAPPHLLLPDAVNVQYGLKQRSA